MSTEGPLKILVSGDVEGKFDQLFTRVRNVQKKAGPFEMLICVGEFFGQNCDSDWQKYKEGHLKVPIVTYILGPNRPENIKYFENSEGGELCENVTYLGKQGVFMGVSGLSIAHMGGTEGRGEEEGHPCHFTRTEIDTLRETLVNTAGFKGVDVLLTSQWPRGTSEFAVRPEGVNDFHCGSDLVSELAIRLKPRYHFAACENVHYERMPYRNHRVIQEKSTHVTRFIALAKVGNKDKKKYMYAFNIVPMKAVSEGDLVKQPEDVTEMPYNIESTGASTNRSADSGNQFFYDRQYIDKMQGRQGSQRGRGGAHKRAGSFGHQQQGGGPPAKRPLPTGPCWFCLGSPDVEKHLVISVGTQVYLALAKGGLVPQHILITPIGHYQSTVELPPEVREEMEKYKLALKKFYKSQNKSFVLFERNYKTQHLQQQICPIDEDKAGEAKEIFLVHGQEHQLELYEIPRHSDIKQIVAVHKPYFYVELESGDKLLCNIRKGFPLQFGREVMTSPEILNMPDRVNWKACSLSKEEETALAAKVREKFQPFDFNL